MTAPKSLPNFSITDSAPSVAIPTGFQQLDAGLNGGLELGRAYLIASVEKSGKTSYLRKMLYQMALSRTIVGMIDVEQQEDFFIKAITCLWANKKILDITTEDTNQTRAELEDRFVYVNRINGSELITNSLGEIEVEKCIQTFERMVDERGVQVCVFDNVTPLASEGRKASSNQRMMMMNGLCSLAKRKNVIVIVVGHVNSSTQEVIGQAKIQDIAEGRMDPSRMIQDSILTVKRPTTKDVFGGSILTQFDAKFYIWRPFQNYSMEKLRRYAWLMVEDCRYSPPFNVPMYFFGDSLNFVEIPPKTENDVFDGGVL